MLHFQRPVRVGLCVGLIGVGTLVVHTQESPAPGEWRYFGGSKAFTRYSPLDQINRDNVGSLRIVWRRSGAASEWTEAFPELSANPYLKSTPLMIDGVLYAPNALGLVEAFDPGTGETIWQQEPFASTVRGVAGQSTRGLAYWNDDSDERLFLVRGEYLYALDMRTGRRIGDFGLSDQGRVDLHWDRPMAARFSWTSGPIVVGDVVVVAGTTGGAGDGGAAWEAAPEDVRGFDVRTGQLRWTFHVVPREGEFGVETWGDDSGLSSGDLGSWCCLTADEELGYVYVPLSAPTSSIYGGHRPGDNLFSDSLVALDAATGERVWHFQMVHHDLWEYDNMGPAILGDLTVDGRRIKAVMQPSKTGFLYVFDRVTGEPVWPIKERPVPQSTVPGEQTSPTQPFPTKPPPFDRQGLTVADLIDFTPELRAEALELLEPYVLGPLFTPPSLWSEAGTRGTVTIPGGWGAGNWHTGAFDPDTGMYYAVSHTLPGIRGVFPNFSASGTMDYASPPQRGELPDLHGLPITKPPYGRITAFALTTGEQAWMAANGDGPRDHPLLRDLNLPPLGTPNRPAPLVTKTLLLIGEGSDAVIGTVRRRDADEAEPEFSDAWKWGKTFRAYDKSTGTVIWETELPSGTTAGPMTYMFNGKQYVVVSIGARDHSPEWIALALP